MMGPSLPPPLLLRSDLLPGESLTSLLVRLAALNHCNPPGILDRVYRQGLRDNWQYPRQAIVYARLSALTKIAQAELYLATAHRFATILTPPESDMAFLNLQGQTLALLDLESAVRQIRSDSWAQFCPECLREAAYHRLIWIPTAVAACLKHERLLVGSCPGCRKPITTRAVAMAHCTSCGADLRKTQSNRLDGDPFGMLSQRVIQSWLSFTSLPNDLRFLALPEQSPRVLYRVLCGLQFSIMWAAADWEYLHCVDGERWRVRIAWTALAPGKIYFACATAFKGLINWPDGFREFLRAYSSRVGRCFQGELGEALGGLYSNWLQKKWQYPLFEFLQEAFDQYVLDNCFARGIMHPGCYRNRPSLARRFPNVTLADAANLLRVSPETVAVLVRIGRLAAQRCPQDAQTVLLRQTEVLELGREWDVVLLLAEAAHCLGLPEDVVTGLMESGLLAAKHGTEGARNCPCEFERRTLEEFRCRAVQNTADGPAPLGAVGLVEAARMLAVLGLDAAGVLSLLVEGKFPAYCSLRGLPVLSDLLFDRTAIQDYTKTVGRMSHREVAGQMGLPSDVILEWTRSGFLSPAAVVSSIPYFDQAAVERFAAEYVPSREVAKILRIEVSKVSSYAHRGLLVAVSGPSVDGARYCLFRRRDIEQITLRGEHNGKAGLRR